MQLITVLNEMEQGELSLHVTSRIPNAQGVYQLFHKGSLVYIGKTDAQAGLRQRLSRHAWTIQSRHNLNVAEMSFRAVEVLVFSAFDLETALIAHYREKTQTPAWNGSGFGANDPGRQRDRTALRQDGFDANYPINIDLELGELVLEGLTGEQVLARVSGFVPYTLRHERTTEAMMELRSMKLARSSLPTVRAVIGEVCRSLEPGWQATKLPGRVILYRENIEDYPGGEIIARS